MLWLVFLSSSDECSEAPPSALDMRLALIEPIRLNLGSVQREINEVYEV